ncbi:mechanosensitive ion channel protein MscS [Sphingomonas sp. Root710]|uniref:mechanosensitive ion channel family protein n=1 Tax=Sphingomonas sp. Root710 TaxID=1736594 RepID=UPI0006FCD4B5|nr:mechanosensitive ion channel domain-containing protein [Sphingomonas sp. Root710]KRB82906.1 mechanosensitive ion channel protein MscS [Sphingomonas sp. Root710]
MEFFLLPGLGDRAVQQALAVALISLASFALAELIARRLTPPLIARWPSPDNGQSAQGTPGICALLRWAVALMLLVAASMIGFEALAAQLILSAAMGSAAGLFVHRLARTAGAGPLAIPLGITAFTGTVVGALQGLEPLLAGLNAASVSVGSRQISLLGVLNGVVVIALLFMGTRIAIRLIGRSIDQVGGLDRYQRVLIQKLVAVAFVVIAALMGIDLLGIDLTALAVFSGAFGLAVGFGLQKTFGNLLSGLILLMDRSVKPGDVIVVGDTFGWVNKIGVRAVSVVTRDGKEHLIPNELLMTERVENWSFSSRDVRIRMPLAVAYDSDLELAERLMIQAATECPRVLSTPQPNVWLRSFGERGVEYDILVWISDPEQGVGNVQSDILGRIWRLFRDHNVEIPLPQRDIHIKSWPLRGRDRSTG